MTVLPRDPAVPGWRDGLRVLLRAPDRLLVPTIVLSVVTAAIQVLVLVLLLHTIEQSHPCPRVFGSSTVPGQCGVGVLRNDLNSLIGALSFLVLGQLLAGAVGRAALAVLDDRPAEGPFAGFRDYLPTAVAAAALVLLGLVLGWVPGLVVAFGTRYAVLAAADQRRGVLASLYAGLRLVLRHPVGELAFCIGALLVLALGLALLGFGFFAAVPLVLLVQAGRYRHAVPQTQNRLSPPISAS